MSCSRCRSSSCNVGRLVAEHRHRAGYMAPEQRAASEQRITETQDACDTRARQVAT